MENSSGQKRKIEDDDELFSYGNTMELAFGKKSRPIAESAKCNINNEEESSDSDEDGGLIDSDSCDEMDNWQRSTLSVTKEEYSDNETNKTK